MSFCMTKQGKYYVRGWESGGKHNESEWESEKNEREWNMSFFGIVTLGEWRWTSLREKVDSLSR